MNIAYRIQTNKKTISSFYVKFYQGNSTIPCQIIHKDDKLYLPLQIEKKIIIEVTNNTKYYQGVFCVFGLSNISLDGSNSPSHVYNESIFDLNPKSTIKIENRFKNLCSKEKAGDLKINEFHYGLPITLYSKIGTPIFEDNNETMIPQWVNYSKRFHKLCKVIIKKFE
jgi:hypothetical protein